MRGIGIFSVLITASLLTACQTIDDVGDSIRSSLEAIQRELSTASADPNEKSTEATGKGITDQSVQGVGSSASTSQKEVSLANQNLTLSGIVQIQDVIDGDTIKLRDKRIRLFGIDAPELSQTCTVGNQLSACGDTARQALVGFLLGAAVRCERKDIDRYGRDVSKCFVNEFDVSSGMVRSGMAVAYRKYSKNYVEDEERAKKSKLGIWKGTFVMPWDWRRQRKR